MLGDMAIANWKKKGKNEYTHANVGLFMCKLVRLVPVMLGPRYVSCVFEVKHLGLQVKPDGHDASLSWGLTNNPSLLMMREKPYSFLSL